MLLSVAQKISNTLEQCRLLLLAMRKFPNLVFEHGVSYIDFLIHKYTVVREVNTHTFIHTSTCNRVFVRKFQIWFLSTELVTFTLVFLVQNIHAYIILKEFKCIFYIIACLNFLQIKWIIFLKLKLLDTLQQAELEAKMKYPVNCYRKLFGKCITRQSAFGISKLLFFVICSLAFY